MRYYVGPDVAYNSKMRKLTFGEMYSGKA